MGIKIKKAGPSSPAFFGVLTLQKKFRSSASLIYTYSYKWFDFQKFLFSNTLNTH